MADDTIIKASTDQKSYRNIFLSNGLQALLVSDPKTDTAAASLDVYVGSFADPDCALGLAHFLEHMLFLGTEKYPEENSYANFISSYGGRNNAYTSGYNTNYYFDIVSNKLEEALDRFSQFFISPLFTENGTTREMIAVDSEYAKNKQKDDWRTRRLQYHTTNPKHPSQRFTDGNLVTLKDRPLEAGVDIRDELLKFHAKYYSASKMKLAVVGKDSLDVLEKLVEQNFSQIKNLDGSGPISYKHIPQYEPEHLQKIYRFVTVKKYHFLNLHFPFPNILDQFLKRPLSFFNSLIGDESHGSILALLKKKGWAYSLTSFEDDHVDEGQLFKIYLKLTDEGLENWEEVVSLIFQYTRVMIDSGFPDRLHEEISAVANAEFNFQDECDPYDYVVYLSNNMQKYPPKYILAGNEIHSEFDREYLIQLAKNFHPSNSNIFIGSKKFEGQTNLEEPNFNILYSLENFTEEQLRRWSQGPIHPELHLYEKNEFISTKHDIKLPHLNKLKAEKTEERKNLGQPSLIQSDEWGRLWFRYDDVFNLPKASIFAALTTPHTSDSVRNVLLSTIYVELVRETLNKIAYPATVAGLNYELGRDSCSIYMTVSGFDEKSGVLLLKLVQQLFNLEISPELFALSYEKLKQYYKGLIKSDSLRWAQSFAYPLFDLRCWDMKSIIDAVDHLTLDDVVEYSKLFKRSVVLEMLVHGNFEEEEAKTMYSLVKHLVISSVITPLPHSHFISCRCGQLPKNKTMIVQEKHPNVDDNNSSIHVIFQIGPDSPLDFAKILLFRHFADDHFFDQLRTKEQLGYIVTLRHVRIWEVLHVIFEIQSPVKDPSYLLTRIDSFIDWFRNTHLPSITADVFESNLKALITKVVEPEKTLLQLSQFFFQEIESRSYQFDRGDRLEAALSKFELKDLADFIDSHLSPSSSTRLVSMVYGNEHDLSELPAETGVIITKGEEFKRSLSQFPDYRNSTW